MPKKDFSLELKKIISQEEWLMNILRAVRDLRLPDWYLAAGVVRNTVWDVLHGYSKRTPLNDIDVVFFDPSKLFSEKKIEMRLKKKFPHYSFEAVNQSFVHEMYPHKPKVHSSCEAIGSFVEIPTCVGVRLEQDDSFTICAPHGLLSLFSLEVAPTAGVSLQKYEERVKSKQWEKLWPKLHITYL